MMTRMPRWAAWRAYSAVRSGERWADVTSISYVIPNSSRALPASRMISRSESLPITIETCGLLIIAVHFHSWNCKYCCHSERSEEPNKFERHERMHRSFAALWVAILVWSRCKVSLVHKAKTLLLLQRPRCDVLAIMRLIKTNLGAGLIGALNRRLQFCGPRGYAEHTATRSVESPIPLRGAGMKDLYRAHLNSALQPANLLAHLIASGVAARCHHHADRRIVRPLKIAIAGTPVDRCFHGLEQVAFESHQNRLRLGIAEAAIEFEHHRSARRHHQSAIENALVLRSLGLHARDNRPRDVGDEPVAHLVVDDGGSGVGAHAAGVWSGVAVARALVILRGNERRHAIAVAYNQK